MTTEKNSSGKHVATTNQIKIHQIHPSQPQENGKIERFWYTLDTSLKHKDQLEEFRNEYNNYWDHRGLLLLTGKEMTPAEAWESMEHYSGQPDPKLIYF